MRETEKPVIRLNREPAIGARYAMGAVFLCAGAMWLAPWGLLLLWPAAGLGLVAAGYLGAGARVFGKRDGRVGIVPRIVMAPYLLALALWRGLERRSTRRDVLVAPGIRLGRLVTRRESEALLADGVTAVLDLTCEHDETGPLRRDAVYLNLPVLDLSLPALDVLEEAVRFVLAHRDSGDVLVHCAQGFGRSAMVVAACLVTLEPDLTDDDVRERIVAVRPRVRIRDADAMALLAAYRRGLASESE
ncbi:MAG: phosphatase domain-containing putative toxin [Planctomycetota bacterium]|jgi:protein phosphatase